MAGTATSGAKGKPKSQAHRDAIAAGVRRYMASREGAAHRTAMSQTGVAPKQFDGTGLPTYEPQNYQSAHRKARIALAGRPCAAADDSCAGRIEAAFRHDTPTERSRYESGISVWSPDPTDYLPLCTHHHARYDHGQLKLYS